MARVKTVMLSDYGMVAAFDEAGRQIPELQIPFHELWADYASRLGHDVNGVSAELPSRMGTITRTDYGWLLI